VTGAFASQTLGSGALAAESSKGGWQIAIYTRPWAKQELPVTLDAMAEAGYRYAGLMTSPKGTVISLKTTLEEAQRIGEEAKKRGLSIVSVYGGGFPVKKGGQDLEESIKGLKKLLDNTAATGCRSLLLGGTGGADLQEPYYKTVAACCSYAAEKGMTISVKPHGPLNSTGETCRKIVQSVGKKNFGVWYDPGNVLFYSAGMLDPIDDAATVDGMVFGISVKDWIPLEKRDPSKYYSGRVDVTPGTGKVNFPRVMERLKKGGFTSGPLVIECHAPGADLRATLQEAKKARLFVEQLVQA
jgi:sugar phosphate isomerase/epimerase